MAAHCRGSGDKCERPGPRRLYWSGSDERYERFDDLARHLVFAVELDLADRFVHRCEDLGERTRLLHRATRIARPVRKEESKRAVRQLAALLAVTGRETGDRADARLLCGRVEGQSRALRKSGDGNATLRVKTTEHGAKAHTASRSFLRCIAPTEPKDSEAIRRSHDYDGNIASQTGNAKPPDDVLPLRKATSKAVEKNDDARGLAGRRTVNQHGEPEALGARRELPVEEDPQDSQDQRNPCNLSCTCRHHAKFSKQGPKVTEWPVCGWRVA